ncbi:hypothetical protein CIPAW_07G128800 [Carya illinoinensis]|uniref:DNAJ-containing protein X-domain domain-containing protein n=1 Tax=Carya illinoinensis TaxID=32201 RepID=A0A8T1Q2L0_CARIL|nr:hypothetical protein CIPAW_07G128800 [Carya illinoinensis]
MIDSLWKLNVADIEATLSRVCQMVLQDNNAKKEELHARAKGLKTLGKFFQRVKSANGNDTEMILNGGVHKLNGSESSKLNGSESRKMNGSESSNDATSSTSLRAPMWKPPTLEALTSQSQRHRLVLQDILQWAGSDGTEV